MNVNERNVFVLMRVYSQGNGTELADIMNALNSILSNNTKEVETHTLIYDDSGINNKVYEKILNFYPETKKSITIIPDCKEKDTQGESYSMYSLYKEFCRNAGDKDLCIIINQGEKLFPHSLKHILHKIDRENADILVTKVRISSKKKNKHSEIEARHHNKLVRRLSRHVLDCSCCKSNEWNLRNKKQWPLERILRSGVFHLDTNRRTRIYNKKVLNRFLQDIDNYFNAIANKFVNDYRLYSELLDYVMLLYPDIRIAGLNKTTYDFCQKANPTAITPDFRTYRNDIPAYLLALIILTYRIKDQSTLVTDGEYKLARFISFFINKVENILNDYRTPFVEGDSSYGEICTSTYPGYFVDTLTRLSLIFSHRLSDTSSNGQDIDTLSTNYFEKLLVETRHIYNIKEVYLDGENNDASYILRKSSNEESLLHPRKSKNQPIYNLPAPKIFEKFIHQRTPQNHTKCFYIITVIILIVAVLISVYLLYLAPDCCITSNSKNIPDEIVAVVIGILTASISFCFSKIAQFREKCAEQQKIRKVFCEEFLDMVRHLEANVKVLIQIRKKLKKGFYPQTVHFLNLPLPESSLLLKEDIDKNVAKGRLSDISRIRINLRNISNSAIAMAKYSEYDFYDSARMREFLDWEITRYCGYLANFRYIIKSQKFEFPSIEKLDTYIEADSLVNYLSTLFLDYPYQERHLLARKYLEKYKRDRRKKRAVLLFNSPQKNTE